MGARKGRPESFGSDHAYDFAFHTGIVKIHTEKN